MFELAWGKTERYRNPNKELNKVFNMFERKDAKHWSKWKFYPGAMTIMIPRFLFALLTGLTLTLIVWVMMIGHDINAPLKPGCRKSIIRLSYRCMVFLQSLFSWFTILSHTYEDTDYSYWLGDEAH
jgi:hypothetical protein